MTKVQLLNVPYVKIYDETGNVSNPITKYNAYANKFPTRKERRSHKNEVPFKGNHKGISLTIIKTAKFYRCRQAILLKTGKVKFINHYLTN